MKNRISILTTYIHFCMQRNANLKELSRHGIACRAYILSKRSFWENVESFYYITQCESRERAVWILTPATFVKVWHICYVYIFIIFYMLLIIWLLFPNSFWCHFRFLFFSNVLIHVVTFAFSLIQNVEMLHLLPEIDIIDNCCKIQDLFQYVHVVVIHIMFLD